MTYPNQFVHRNTGCTAHTGRMKGQAEPKNTNLEMLSVDLSPIAVTHKSEKLIPDDCVDLVSLFPDLDTPKLKLNDDSSTSTSASVLDFLHDAFAPSVDETVGTQAEKKAPPDRKMPAKITNKKVKPMVNLTFVEDHHVVLKEKSEGTEGTVIFKKHVRAIFPRSAKFCMASLVQLQNMCYHCNRHPRATKLDASSTQEMAGVIFWISEDKVKKHPDWALEPEEKREIRYWRKKDPSGNLFGDVRVVRASDQCIRHELANNGGRTPESRARQKRSLPAPVEEDNPPMMAMKRLKTPPPHHHHHHHQAMHFPSELQKAESSAALFQEACVLNLKDNLKKTCETWVAASVDRIDRAGRQSLVEQFWVDFEKEKKLRQSMKLVENDLSADDYDRLRQSIHDKSLVRIANELGNAMVDWYGQHSRAKNISRSTNDEKKKLSNLINTGPPFYAAAGENHHQRDHHLAKNENTKGSFDGGFPKSPPMSDSDFFSTFGVNPPDPCGVPTVPADWWRASLDTQGTPGDMTQTSDGTKALTSDSKHDNAQLDPAVPETAHATAFHSDFTSRENGAGNVAVRQAEKDSTAVAQQAIRLNNQAVVQIASGHAEALGCFHQALELLEDGCLPDNAGCFQMTGQQNAMIQEGIIAGTTVTLPQNAHSCLKVKLPILDSYIFFYICHQAFLLDEKSTALDSTSVLKAYICFNQALSFHAEGYRCGSSQKLRHASDAYHQCVTYMGAAKTPCQSLMLAAMNNQAELMIYQLGDQVKAEQLLDQVSRRVTQVRGSPTGGDQQSVIFSLGVIELREIEMNLYIARQFIGGTAAAA